MEIIAFNGFFGCILFLYRRSSRDSGPAGVHKNLESKVICWATPDATIARQRVLDSFGFLGHVESVEEK